MEGKDLSKGNLLKNMTLLLIPLVLTNILNSIYNIVDGIWVGNLIGEDGVSAITNSFPIIVIIRSLGFGLFTAESVLVAQYFGAKKYEKIKEFMGVTYLLGFIIGIVSVIIMFLTSSIWLKLLNTPTEVFEITKNYLIFYIIGFMLNIILTIIMEGLRAIGNTKIPLVFVAITSILNIFLDPIFIKMGYGVTGTAIATMVSIFIGMIISVIYASKKSNLLKIDLKYLKLKKNYIKDILKIGLPITLEEIFLAIVAIFSVGISNQSGIVGSAAYGIGDRYADTIYVISLSFETMATVTVGQFVGNKKVDEIKNIVKQGLKLLILPCFLILIVTFVVPKQFCRIFVKSDDVINLATKYLAIIGIPYIFSPIKKLLQGVIAGTGHTKILMLSICTANVVEILTYIILNKTNMESIVKIGIGALLWLLTDLTICTVYFFSNKWKREVIER